MASTPDQPAQSLAQPKRPRRAFAVLLPFLLLGIGVLGLVSLIKSKAEHTPPAAKEKTWYVQTRPLIAGSYSPTLELLGVVEAPNQFRARAPGVGWVKSVGAREGQNVKQGDPLIVLDEADFEAALIKAETELAEATAQITEAEATHKQNLIALDRERKLLSLSEANLNRLTQLAEKALGSQQQLDLAQREYQQQRLSFSQRELAVNNYESRRNQLEARKKRTESSLSQAHRALQQSQVIAPVDGIVASMELSVGDRVNSGQELVTVYSPEALEVRALIPARYQDELGLGASDSVNAFSDDGRRFTLDRLAGVAQAGGIDGFFTPVSDPQSTRSPLRPGALITLRLARPSVDNSFAVPAAALYNNARLYVMREGRMLGVDIEQIGHVFTDSGERLLMVRGEHIGDQEALIVTRLPNAMSGLKVTTESPASTPPAKAAKRAKPQAGEDKNTHKGQG